MPLPSCKTPRASGIPRISFPAFPELSGAVSNRDGTVSVPEAWIMELAEYKIRIGETERLCGELYALYGEE